MTEKLIIRADSDTQIGTGHVMRCIALAQAWQDQGGHVTFLSHCENEGLQQRIIDEGFDFIPIEKPHPDPSDLKATIDLLLKIRNPQSAIRNWLVLDGYHFTPHYQCEIKEAGHRLFVIDDMAHLNHYYADVLLNQNIHASKLPYSCDRRTKKLLGCEYVLFRREFLKYKDWKREIPDKAKKILATMGGSDPDNVTFKIIEAIKFINDPSLKVKIIVGPLNLHVSELRAAVLHAPCSMLLVQNATNMPELMAWADVAISAGGSTCWEMAFMGLPNLIITISDNQAGIAEGLARAGATVDLGWHANISVNQCAQALKESLQDKMKRSCLSEQGQKVINGSGKQEIIRAMLAGQIKLRRAQENDCDLLWKWANDPEVRQSAFNSKDIEFKDHESWFLNKQNDPDCFQYIALNKHNMPIGQIRFDIKDSIAEIDYSIDKDFRGIGLGKVLLKSGIELFCGEEGKPITIQGYVKNENEPSKRSFQDAGFIETNKNVIDGYDVSNTRTIYQLRFLPP